MQLRTEWTPTQMQPPVDIDKPVLVLGSCFAENVAPYLARIGMHCQTGPTGICYNPASVATAWSVLDHDWQPKEEEFVFDQGLVQHFDFHGSFGAPTIEQWRSSAQKHLQKVRDVYSSAGTLIITLGTAWVYEHRKLKKIVTNCHKQSAKMFDRRLLSVEQCVAVLEPFVARNLPQKNIIFSVSPVRHLRDSMNDNQISKATLQLCLYQLRQKYPQLHYFPAYEIVLDDLRDYRFYNSDMTHPNQLAQDYVWEKFCTYGFPKETQSRIEEFQKLWQFLSHRPLHSHSRAQHNADCREKLANVRGRYPQADFSFAEAFLEDNPVR